MNPVIPMRLSPPEHRAVRHLLEHSALAACPGIPDRVRLSDAGDLVVRDLADWRWSSGEWVLLEVLAFIVGESQRWPDLTRLDDHEQLIVREAMRLLCREGVAS